MAQRAKKPARGGQYSQFPPEADADFGIVPVEDIASWRENLNVRFGIGSGRLKVIEDVETRA